MKQCIIVGGSNGIGLAILNILYSQYDKVTVFDIIEPKIKFPNVDYIEFDLSKDNPSDISAYLSKCTTLIITAGIGRVSPFEKIDLPEIDKIIKVNLLSTIKLLKLYYCSLLSNADRYCLVMGSLAGELSSPLFSVYSASKAGINRFIESVNIELEMRGVKNRITNILPISFKGSSFNGYSTDVKVLNKLASECLDKMYNRETQYIPDYENLCSKIIENYKTDSHQFGLQSYTYKLNNQRISDRKLIKVGYLSGTFDLFHIGHLNLLKNAKRYCDYLIVGVHKSGSWKGKETFISFEERYQILKSIKYVDEVHESFAEDSDAWGIYKYDILFVGSDYKGTERFKKYEEYFKDKNVEIKYFPYTQGTSSTQLREAIKKGNKS